jgi:transposase
VGNTKKGNKYLSWAFFEAAHFAIRDDPLIRRFYQRKEGFVGRRAEPLTGCGKTLVLSPYLE